MDNNKIILISLTEAELSNIISNAVKEALTVKGEKEILSFREACQYLSCSASSLNKWKSSNLIPYRRLGKRIYFNKAELTSALKEAGIYKKIQELK